MKTQFIPLKDILPNTTYQFRDTSAGKNVTELCRLITAGIEMDPVVIWETTQGYLILDGFQRVVATRKVKGEDAKIRAVVKKMHENCVNIALDIAIAANQKHGATLERADRKKMAIKLLEVNPELYDTVIAEKVGLGARTIANYRKEVKGAQISTRVNAKGEVVNVRKPDAKEKVDDEQSAHEADLQVTLNVSERVKGSEPCDVTSSALESDAVVPGDTIGPSVAEKSNHTTDGDTNLQSELSALANICRMQACELERRADFIEKLNRKDLFTKAEIDLIRYVAEDADALEPSDTVLWYEKTERLKTVCIFISHLLATDNEDVEAVS